MIDAKLVVVGGAKETEVTLKRLPTTIGRAREATITLPHSLVSRQHCEITEENGQLYIRDLNSLNGTYVNNEKIAGKCPLLPEQLLTLGNVTFRAVYEYESGVLDEMPLNGESNGSWTDDGQEGETIAVDVVGLQPRIADASIDTERKSLSTPQILVLDDEQAAADKSISLGAINQLPQELADAGLSGTINLESDSPPIQVDSKDFKLSDDEDTDERKNPSQSSLDSFIRKLPK